VPMALIPSGTASSEPGMLPEPEPQAAPDDEGVGPDAEEDADDRENAKFWKARADTARNGNGRGPAKKASRGFSPAAKANIWKAVDRIATSWEGKFADGVDTVMRRQERDLLAYLTKERAGALEQKRTVNWENVQMDWDQYFAQFADEEWRDEFMPMVEGVITDQGERWAATLGMQFEARNVAAESWFQSYMLEFAQPINDTTKAEIHAMVSQAMADGWSIPQMERQLGLTFNRYLDPNFMLEGRRLTDEEVQWFIDRAPRFRRENIARTETLRASNFGTYNHFKDWGVREKEWLTQIDGRQRPDHGDADGQVQPIDKPFRVGGFPMMQPHDMGMGAPLSQVAQCRCTILPRIPE
jgi:hypothetical protein